MSDTKNTQPAENTEAEETITLRVISGATVKNHMHSILQKLQVSRRGQAAALLRAQRTQA